MSKCYKFTTSSNHLVSRTLLPRRVSLIGESKWEELIWLVVCLIITMSGGLVHSQQCSSRQERAVRHLIVRYNPANHRYQIHLLAIVLTSHKVSGDLYIHGSTPRQRSVSRRKLSTLRIFCIEDLLHPSLSITLSTSSLSGPIFSGLAAR